MKLSRIYRGDDLAKKAVILYVYASIQYNYAHVEICVKERLARLKAVRKLIKTYRIESQETLLGYLQKEGYIVTQATLSRDLKLLKVGKISDGHNGYV
jgi:hypothetical protein